MQQNFETAGQLVNRYCSNWQHAHTIASMAHTAHDLEAVRALVDQGLSADEIAVELNLPRPLIDSMIGRAAPRVPQPRRPAQPIPPWDVAPVHEQDEDARMLRLEQRRRLGEGLTQEELDALTDWRHRLQDMDGVIDYDAERGFHWTKRIESDWDIVRLPVGA